MRKHALWMMLVCVVPQLLMMQGLHGSGSRRYHSGSQQPAERFGHHHAFQGYHGSHQREVCESGQVGNFHFQKPNNRRKS